MAWEGSNRRSRLPADWPKIRERVLRRDGYRCRFVDYTGLRCREQATEVDHIEAMKDDHRDEALQSLCERHHASKSGSEGGRASAVQSAVKRKRLRKPPEPHPGLL